jgi:DNA ligase-1
VIPQGFKPNLAATLTKPELIKFPVYCSPKIDGIRCVVFGGVAYSRSLKPVPNKHVQAFFDRHADVLDGLDGELVVGSKTGPNCMQNSMAVMRRDGDPNFCFYVFDVYDPRAEYEERLTILETAMQHFMSDDHRINLVGQHLANNADDLATLEAQFLERGYEGLMIRRPDSLYKFGRSTEREGGLVKVKRFVDAEARVIGFVEEMENTNEAKRDALGNVDRSTAKAGLVGKGTLGALVVRDEQGREFNVGTGFKAIERAYMWEYRETLLGKHVTYKYFDHGIKEAPRHPVFKAFRAPEDMSE